MKKSELTNCQSCSTRDESVFCDLRGEDITTLSRNKACRVYKKGQTLFHEGTGPSGVFCIKEGKVKIFKTGIDGRDQIVRIAKSGDLVGYRSFLAEEFYSATAMALEDTQVCFLDKRDFNAVMDSNEGLSKSLIKLLTKELRESENLILGMAQKSVRQRVAEALLILKGKLGTDPSDPQLLNSNLSREELSNYVGTATETLIRLLSEFKEEGAIETKGRKIRILNQNALVDIANVQF